MKKTPEITFLRGEISFLTNGKSSTTGEISFLTDGKTFFTGGISFLTDGITFLTGEISFLMGGIFLVHFRNIPVAKGDKYYSLG